MVNIHYGLSYIFLNMNGPETYVTTLQIKGAVYIFVICGLLNDIIHSNFSHKNLKMLRHIWNWFLSLSRALTGVFLIVDWKVKWGVLVVLIGTYAH